jgi:hypothetical protein
MENPIQEVQSTELIQVREQLLKTQNENADLKMRAIKVFEENEMYKASPELAAQMAEMQFQLKVANHFIASKAFKAVNAEQAYVMIKAGAEMGMKPVEAMQALYCVNGSVKMYGDKMVSRITQAGYKLEYLNETPKGVLVKVTNKEGFVAQEIVTADDPILQKSNAYKFAPKNKMRFHGVRMIASFHLPHLFNSLADEFTADFEDEISQPTGGIDIQKIDKSKERSRIADHIKNAKSAQELEQVLDFIHENDLVSEYNAKLDTFNEAA